MTGRPELVRGLGLAAAVSMNIGNMIGTGVFLKARVMTCNVETPGAVLATWLAAALLVFAGALTYSELAAMLPKAGGEYVFLREAYGRKTAFLYGWSYTVISRGGSLAAQAFSAAIFLNITLGKALGDQLSIFAATIGIVMTLVNCLAVSATGRIATVMTVIKIAIVAGVGVLGFVFTPGDWMNYGLSGAAGACDGVSASARGGIAGFGAAMLGALWGFQGWANLAPLAGEVKEPQRNIPKAFFAGVLVVAAVYLFANASYFFALTPEAVASVPLASSVATVVIEKHLGAGAASFMAAMMLISSIGALHTGIAATMRVPYAMARDGVFVKGLDQVSEGTHVPVRSALAIAVWMGALTFTGSYDKLTDWAIFSLWLFYGLTAAGLFVLRRKLPNAERPYKVWGYPFVPGIFVAVTAFLIVNTIFTAPVSAFAGLAVMAAGLPLYWLWTRRQPTSY